MDLLKQIWQRHGRRKSEANAYSQIWKEHYETIRNIEKRESWLYGFLYGFVFAAAVSVALVYLLKIFY